MAIFDEYIIMVTEYVDELEKAGRSVRIFNSPTSINALKHILPIQVGSGSNPGIILRNDTFVELGNPEDGSNAAVMWTDAPSLVFDGRITLVGPDIPESGGKSLPFGQILMIGGSDLNDAAHEKLNQQQFIGDQIEGYMIRSTSRYMWGRVSKAGAEKGFCFEMLGSALMLIYKSAMPEIQSMEAVFVTSTKEDVKALDSMAAQVKKISQEIVKETWKIRGYDIDCAFDCSSCKDKAVCDDIRAVLEALKKKRAN